MLFLLSPAKSLDYETPVAAEVEALATRPEFVAEAKVLIDLLRPQTPLQIAKLMDLSDALAQLNVARYGAWSTRFTPHNSKPAALAFNGDVYEGLQAQSLSLQDLVWAQQHVAILSGLYGALKPLDRLQPYRLEMGTHLANPAGSDLYAYWAETLSPYLNRRQAKEKAPVVINLASQEYFKAVKRKTLKARVVECVFEEGKGGEWKIVSFFAKRARGLMARWAIQHRIERPEDLAGFDVEGYAFSAAHSSPDRMVFRRAAQA